MCELLLALVLVFAFVRADLFVYVRVFVCALRVCVLACVCAHAGYVMMLAVTII